MLKTAIIGAGDISKPHARAIHALGIEIAGILDFNEIRAKELADEYNSKVINTLDEVLDDIDIVHIFTPPSKRVEYVSQAALAGKHIFIEKPIAISISDAKEIVNIANEKNVKLMVGFNHRLRSGYRMLKETVQDGKLGEIINVFSYRMGAGRGFDGTPIGTCWRTDPKKVCGMSIESVSHEIDMLLHLVDGVKSVKANTYSTTCELPEFDNNVAATFRLKNGGTGVINASWSSHINYSTRGVIGTKGTAMLTGDAQFNCIDFKLKTSNMPYETVVKVNDRFETTNALFESPSYFEINRLFKESIENDLTPEITGDDGLKALIFSHAILESSKTEQTVAVDL